MGGRRRAAAAATMGEEVKRLQQQPWEKKSSGGGGSGSRGRREAAAAAMEEGERGGAMESSPYAHLLEKNRLPHPSFQRLAVVSIFQKLGSAPPRLGGFGSDPGRDALSRCLTSPSPAVVDQAVRELCRYVNARGPLDVSRGLIQLQSALDGCDPDFVTIIVSRIRWFGLNLDLEGQLVGDDFGYVQLVCAEQIDEKQDEKNTPIGSIPCSESMSIDANGLVIDLLIGLLNRLRSLLKLRGMQ